MKRTGLILALLLLSGCATGTGARWWAPATWGKHRPADNVDNAIKTEDKAREAVLKAAQKSAHETAFALSSAPHSRPVAVATGFNADTVSLLDQATGALAAPDLSRLRETVAGLLSENAELRAKAEAAQRAEQSSIASVAGKLAEAQVKTADAEKKLRGAFDRENALANELRSQRAFLWILGGLAVLVGIGAVYLRLTLGGIPTALGGALSKLTPDARESITSQLDSFLNRSEQALVRAAFNKHSNP